MKNNKILRTLLLLTLVNSQWARAVPAFVCYGFKAANSAPSDPYLSVAKLEVFENGQATLSSDPYNYNLNYSSAPLPPVSAEEITRLARATGFVEFSTEEFLSAERLAFKDANVPESNLGYFFDLIILKAKSGKAYKVLAARDLQLLCIE